MALEQGPEHQEEMISTEPERPTRREVSAAYHEFLAIVKEEEATQQPVAPERRGKVRQQIEEFGWTPARILDTARRSASSSHFDPMKAVDAAVDILIPDDDPQAKAEAEQTAQRLHEAHDRSRR